MLTFSSNGDQKYTFIFIEVALQPCCWIGCQRQKSHSSALAAQETDLILHEFPSEYFPGYVSKPLQYEYVSRSCSGKDTGDER